ncbi:MULTISPECIES: nucleotide exchange factor GrpE [Corynebacterium]|uniref:nucleotide exchange factor GrpE n=1 Tax=Corynebacterium TaxID=1716 RepID=UPI0025519325|nr:MULTISPECIES: nucleotide exchange factor GrpE [Corynebacterium]MDK6301654.1 nucleotide exchange factor GrpE [Corynebacterium sp. UMB9976]WOH94268.1 nucleotide exchange factor GrpE [Corynebacterium urealyticum]
MTNAHTSGEMPDNPGDPAVTDPEADAAVDNAGEAPGESPEAAVKAQEDAQRDAAEAAADDAAADLADGDDTVDPSVDPEAAVSPAEAELAERTEDLKRVTAEYANYRRRAERDREAAVEAAKAGLATDLLPILDDLDLAAEHGDLTGPLKAMSDKLNTVLRGAKVEVFGAEGDAFDPELHEAVQDMSSGDEKAVGTVLRKGYRMGERVLRHAMVVIADPQ